MSGCDLYSQEQNPLKSPQPVINVAFSYPDGMDSLRGVEKDVKRISKINSRLYGNTGGMFRDSNVLVTCEKQASPAICQNFRKRSFINQMKEFIGQRQSPPIFNYSGHGLRCQKPGGPVEFCMVLPSDGIPFECEERDFGLMILNKGCEDYFITTKEIVENFNPKILIADSCHSGQMTLDIEQLQTTTTVIASSLSHEKASDAGELFSILHSIATADTKNLCRLDIDGDGNISLPESLFGIYGSNLKYYRKALSMRGKGPNYGGIDVQFPTFSGFSGADFDFNSCFLQPENGERCPTTNNLNAKDNKNCSDLVKKMNLVKNNVNLILSDPDSTKFLLDPSGDMLPLSNIGGSFTRLSESQKVTIRKEYQKNLSAMSDYLKGYMNNYFFPAEAQCKSEDKFCQAQQSFESFIILQNKLDDMQNIHQFINN